MVVAAASTQMGVACNRKPMALVIESPGHGSFSTGASVLVTGRVKRINPDLASLTVNGAVVAIQPDRTWSTSVPLDSGAVFNPVLVELTNTSTGEFRRRRIVVIAGLPVADGDLSLDSVALRFNDAGLDQVEPVMESLVDLDLASMMPVGTQVIDDYCVIDSIFGCIGRVDAEIDNPPPSIGGFTLDVDSMKDFAAGDIALGNLQVELYIDGHGVAPNCGWHLSASSTDILGDYALRPDAFDPSNIDVNLMRNVGVSFSGFNDSPTWGLCDFPLIGDLIQLIVGDLEPMVIHALKDFLNDPDRSGPLDSPVADAIEEALAGVEITGPIGEGLGVTLDAPLFAVDEDTQGITLGSDASFQSNVGAGPGQCDAPEEAPDLAASLDSTDPFPAFAQCTGGTNDGTPCLDNAPCVGGGRCRSLTAGGLPYGLAIASSRGAFNQLLKAQTECGLLVLVGDDAIREIEILGTTLPLTAWTLSFWVPQFRELYPLETPFRIELVPSLAPLITGNAGPHGELGELRIAQLRLEIIQDDGSEFVPLAGVFDARVGLEMTFDDLTGSLSFQLGEVDPADVSIVITTDRIFADELALEQNVLPNVLAFVLPSLASNLGEFPLPGFLGLELQGVEVARQGDFLSLFADLVPAP